MFIKKNFKSKKKSYFNLDKQKLLYRKHFSFNNIALFKYSAITNNSHRIHYDFKYAREEEGYKDILVHGPLLALFALDQFRKK